MAKTKLELILEIIDWEHRYIHGRLQGGSWVLQRTRELMTLRKAEVVNLWNIRFNVNH